MRTNRKGNLILKNATVQNHAPNPEDLSKRRIISEIRIRARTTTKSPRRLLADCLSRSITSVSPLFPSYNSLQRNSSVRCSPLIIPEQYKISFRNKNFLLYDGVEIEGERFILFATTRQLNILSWSSNIYFDSTFKSVPKIFYQLFVIHGEYNNVLIPRVFALMERKTEIMYRRVWEKSEKMLKSHAKLPYVILRRHLLIHLCFTI
ncbi:hypothetical protein HZS_7078 [Henneguya salminicola]|nr:hypothetical protein HZS_7078 [Henneguya salminicola]